MSPIVVLSDAATIGLAGSATATAWMSSRKAGGRTQKGYVVLAIGLMLWTAGELIWGVYEVLLDQAAPFPSLADAFYLAAYPALFLAMLTFVSPARRSAWLRTALDAAAVTLAITIPVWIYLLKPTVNDSIDSTFSTALAVAYPSGDLLVVFAVALALFRPGRGRSSRFFGLLAAGLVAFVASDLAFAYLSLQDEFGTGTVLDLGWMVGYSLLGLATYLGVGPGTLQQSSDLALRSSAGRQSIPLLVLGVLVAWCLYEAKWGEGIDEFGVFGTLLVVALVLARSYLATSDILHMTDELEETRELLVAANSSLQAKSRTLNTLLTEAVDLSRRDSMTHLFNHAAILEELELALENGPLVVLLLDVDHMKTINDELGHRTGDDVLKSLAATIRSAEGVVGGRYGGDEFLAFATLTGPAEVRLSELISKLGRIAASGLVTSLSIGWAVYPDDGENVSDLVEKADERLYERKRSRALWSATRRGIAS